MSTEVETLLTDKGISFHGKGKDLLVVCLNPEHDDASPSMRIDREDGKYHCLSCGFKGNIFSHFNRHRNIFNSRIEGVRKKIKALRPNDLEMPTDAYYIDEMFRGIPASILKQFRAFRTEKLGMEDRIVFPITDNMETIIGFQGRHALSNASPKYMAYPASVGLPWYPSVNKITPINGSIVLVEGLLDALYLHGKGITNAVTTFGTKSIKFDNVLEHLTPYMLVGVEKVYLLMDGDAAGRNANDHIENCIKQKTDLVVEIILLNEGDDPASLDDYAMNNLINLLHKD